MVQLSKTASLAYKVLRNLSTKMYYLRRDIEIYEEYEHIKRCLPYKCKVDNDIYQQYKKMWGWSRSSFVPRNVLEVCSTLGKHATPEYVPENVYFSTIDPILNNKLMAWGYAEKGNYARLFGIDNEPASLLRNLNGLFFDFKGDLIKNPDEYFSNELRRFHKLLVKPSIESWGGRNVLVFQKDARDHWQCVNGPVDLSLQNLQKYYIQNYVVQEYIEQHAFYKRFNPSSFNTFRVYVYRSVMDEIPHVLHPYIRVGSEGSVIDNIKAGGVGIHLNSDGSFLFGYNKHMEKVDFLPNEPDVKLKELGKAPGIEQIYDLAKKVALKMPFTRMIAFDINLDDKGKPRLIELNTTNAGLPSQFFGLSFFGSFTHEVIEFCRKQKKVDFLRV